MSSSAKCPKCNFFFAWKETSIDDKAPVLLNCGHSLCVLCVNRFQCKIICPVCKKSELKKKDPSSIKFDIYTIGKCFLRPLSRVQLFKKELNGEPQNLIKQSTIVKCMECKTKESKILCTHCQLSLCQNCSQKVHSGKLSKHKVHDTTDDNTELITSDLKSLLTCALHRRLVTAHCTVDNQYLCEACILMNIHQGHHLLPMMQFTEKCVDDLKDRVKDVGVRLISCKQSLNDIQEELKGLMNEKRRAIKSMQSIFAQLHSLLQHKEAEVIEEINDEYTQKMHLQSTQIQLFQSQVNAMQKLLADIRIILNREATENIDFVGVFNAIDAIKKRPCCVKKKNDIGEELEFLVKKENKAGVKEEKESVAEISSEIGGCVEKLEENSNRKVIDCNEAIVGDEVMMGVCVGEVPRDISAMVAADPIEKGKSFCGDFFQKGDIDHALSVLVEKVYLSCPNLMKNISDVSNTISRHFIKQHLPEVCNINPDLQAILEQKIVSSPKVLIQTYTPSSHTAQNKATRDTKKLNFSFEGYHRSNSSLHKCQPSNTKKQCKNYTPTPCHNTPIAPNTPPSTSHKTLSHINATKSLKSFSKSKPPANKYPKKVILPDGLPVKVSHIVNPSHFFIQVLQNIKRIQILEDGIGPLCTSGKTDKMPETNTMDPETMVLAWSSKKEKWMRGRVVEGEERSDASNIFFIDHGHEEFVQYERMYAAHRKHLKLPPLAVQCGLVNLIPLGGAWTDAACCLFREITQDRDFKVKVFEIKEDEAVVDLEDIEDEVLAGSSTSIRDFLLLTEKASQTHLHPYHAPEMKQARLPPPTIPQASTMITAVICLVKHSSTFFINTVNKNLSKLHKLTSLMQEFYKDLKDNQYCILGPVMGSICACKSVQDGKWYRTKILNVELTKGNAVVRYVDVGKVEKVDVNQLRKLKLQFSNLPAQALSCQLVAESQENTLEHLKEWKELGHVMFYVQSNQNLLSLTFIKCLGCQSVPTYHGHNLVDSDSEINQGEITATFEEPCSTSSTSSHDNPTSLDYPPPTPLYDSPTSPDYPLPIPLKANPCIVFLVNIDRHGVLYCHNADSSCLASLNNMMETLNAQGTQSRVGHKARWCRGDIACYSANDVFYRVKILSVFHQTAEVMLVDYGRVEKVMFENLSPPLLTHYPIFCYAVTLPFVQWKKGLDGLVSERITSNVISMIHHKSNDVITLSIQSDVEKDPYKVVADVFLMDGTQLAGHLHCMKAVI